MTCILQHVALIDSLSHWFAIKQLASDSYVAAAGLPEARDDHAKVMARFAAECRFTMNRVVQKLEVLLGPDTGKHVGCVVLKRASESAREPNAELFILT